MTKIYATYKELVSLGLIHYSRTHIYRLVKDGLFPKPKKLGQGRVVWKVADVMALIERGSW